MAWNAYIVDTISGQIMCPIDLPNFSWSVSVADSSLSTTKSKGVGQDEVSGLKVPWTAVPANSPGERSRLLAPDPAQYRALLDKSIGFRGCDRHADTLRTDRPEEGRPARYGFQPD